jgi:predicted glycogen debranching enzyme
MDLKGQDIDTLNGKEWLVTNGIGGYASSTLTGCNTRRYHGLLIASDDPPVARRVVVSKIEETISSDTGGTIGLSANQYKDAIHPQGYQYLMSFDRKPLPRFVYEWAGGRLEKVICMVQGANTTVIEYTNAGDAKYELQLNFLIADRDYHSLLTDHAAYDFRSEHGNGFQKIYSHAKAQPLFIGYSKGTWTDHGYWYRDFEYKVEQERGFDGHEDTYNPGQVAVSLGTGEKVYILLTTDEKQVSMAGEALKAEAIRHAASLRKWGSNEFLNDLAEAGGQFIVDRRSTGSKSIIAGYHWFTDWGRDTMIAMRGICIAQGDKETAYSIIRTFLKYLDRGMLPNRFPDGDGALDYNTIDATLWLAVVCHDYYGKFKDEAFVKEVYPQLTDIIEAHIAGTRYAIHMTEEGLLYGGEGLAQLTWMDARIGGHVVTPRHGCPVEVNMLWYNLLKVHEAFSAVAEGTPFAKLIKLFEKSFKIYFLNEDGYLNDVVVPGSAADKSIRPNQLYAVSLPYTILSKNDQKKITTFVQDHLLTDYGLRTLNTESPAFRPIYSGDSWSRDTAYHQGTVWPFLIGEFFTAYLKVNNNTPKAKKQVTAWMEPLKQHFYDDVCVHGISEVFDGLSPQHGKGTAHQAWSVSALMKVLIEMG